MELFSSAWFMGLLSVILMDLVLAGDNAIVIALAARNLPHHLQKKAILFGTAGAIIIRVLMTLAVAWLLHFPGLKLVGGLGLIWIAFKLMKPHEDHHAEYDGDGHTGEGGKKAKEVGFMKAIETIVIADALMGIDNVLAIAGAARGNMELIILGLLISIPIVIFGSTLVLKLIERFPSIIYIGAAAIAYTAAKMLFTEVLFEEVVQTLPKMLIYGTEVLIVVAVVLIGKLLYSKKTGEKSAS